MSWLADRCSSPRVRRALGLAPVLLAMMLVLTGLASTGLALPERMDAGPLVLQDVQHVAAAGEPATAATTVVAAVAVFVLASIVVAGMAGPDLGRCVAFVHPDADLRRRVRARPIQARGPPGRLTA